MAGGPGWFGARQPAHLKQLVNLNLDCCWTGEGTCSQSTAAGDYLGHRSGSTGGSLLQSLFPDRMVLSALPRSVTEPDGGAYLDLEMLKQDE